MQATIPTLTYRKFKQLRGELRGYTWVRVRGPIRSQSRHNRAGFAQNLAQTRAQR